MWPMSVNLKRRGELHWTIVVAQILFVATLAAGGASPFFPFPYTATWFNLGLGNNNVLNTNNPQLIQNSGSGGGSSGGCDSLGIPCSGYTKDSCQSYCTSIGYPVATCDGFCCLCSVSELQSSPYSGYGTQQLLSSSFLNTINNTQATFTNTVPTYGNSIHHSNLNKKQSSLSSDWTFETQESNRVIGKERYNPNSIYSNGFGSLSRSDSDDGNNAIPVNKPSSHQAVCQTNACHRAGKTLSANMNSNVSPCENFYEFACGGFIQNKQIPSDQAEVTAFTMLRNKVSTQLKTLFNEPLKSSEPKPFHLAKTLYKSCMNTVSIEKLGLEPLNKTLQLLGGWPVLEGNWWQSQHISWSNYVVWFRELGFSHDYFMKISVDPDIKNVNRRAITIGDPTLSFTREVLLRGRSEPGVSAYYKYMVETAVLMGANRATAQREMMDALNFEIELAKSIYRPDDKDSRGSSYYNPVTIADLDRHYPTIPWVDLFQRLLPNKVSVNSQETIMLTVPHYLHAFLSLVARTDVRTISNYAIWRLVASSMTYLPESARRLQFDFTASITGQRDRTARWKECTDLVSASLGNAAGAMYVRRFFGRDSKLQATEMINDIHQSFLQILDDADWMDSSTKFQAKEKARAVRIHVGYPEEHLSDAKLTALYSTYNFKVDDYLGNARNLVKEAVDLYFGKLRFPVNKNDWVTHGKTAVVNAFYLPLENAIQFPAAILQHPFFDSSRPKYMNYGAIGWIAGHELTHGFDDQGHQFDRNGNFHDWWDPFTKQTYSTKTQCIIKQYGKFTPGESGIKLNGVNSQGENVADNGGMKQAYRGYRSWVARNGVEKTLPGLESYTPNQLFWIAAASNWCSVHREKNLRHQLLGGVHSPGEFRVLGTFANNRDFARDFSCPAGSQMNPANKCSVW